MDALIVLLLKVFFDFLLLRKKISHLFRNFAGDL